MGKVRIIFVLDPMCSWCWGFAPVVEKLRATYSEEYHFSLVMGGLRTRGEMPWNQASKSYLQKHWKQVAQRTQQPFSNKLLNKTDFEYDTYPACKAVVTVRELYGEHKSFIYLHKLQENFYRDSEDITDTAVLSHCAASIGIDEEAFLKFYESERAELLMKHDFSKARSMGATAFPSIVMIDRDGHMVCLKGYRSFEEMKKILKENDA